jgi:hypothetical protein
VLPLLLPLVLPLLPLVPPLELPLLPLLPPSGPPSSPPPLVLPLVLPLEPPLLPLEPPLLLPLVPPPLLPLLLPLPLLPLSLLAPLPASMLWTTSESPLHASVATVVVPSDATRANFRVFMGASDNHCFATLDAKEGVVSRWSRRHLFLSARWT